MNGKEKGIMILCGAVLVVLFLLSSTDLILKDEKAEIYPIAVVIDEISDDSYVNFRKGVERAARDLNADVSFITLYEQWDQEQQTKLLLREQQDGNKALIVLPVDQDAVLREQSEKRLTIPLILVNGAFVERENTACITFDHADMGRQLGEALLRERPDLSRVYLVDGGRRDAASAAFAEGICDVLEQAGCPAACWELPVEEEKYRLDDLIDVNTVTVATDTKSLEKMAQFLTEMGVGQESFGGLYGRGGTVSVLNYLDRGVIRGLCVTDDFSAGYLSVKAAVCLADGGTVQNSGCLPGYYIRREDLRNAKFEKMLYPVE